MVRVTKNKPNLDLFNKEDVTFLQDFQRLSHYQSTVADPVVQRVHSKYNTVVKMLSGIRIPITMPIHPSLGESLMWRKKIINYKNVQGRACTMERYGFYLERDNKFHQLSKLMPKQIKELEPYIDDFVKYAVKELKAQQDKHEE